METSDYPEEMLFAAYETWHDPDYRNFRNAGIMGLYMAVKAGIVPREGSPSTYSSSSVRSDIIDSLKMMMDRRWIEQVTDPCPTSYHPIIKEEVGQLLGAFSSDKGYYEVPRPDADNRWFRLRDEGMQWVKRRIQLYQLEKERSQTGNIGLLDAFLRSKEGR